jgi:SAM-dependent methyltransferase
MLNKGSGSERLLAPEVEGGVTAMLRISQAIAVRVASQVAAQQLQTLTKCACCGSDEIEPLFEYNTFRRFAFVARPMKISRYSLCSFCGTIFAAVRMRPEYAQSLYDMFSVTHKRHDIYPPPSSLPRAKREVVKEILDILQSRKLLHDGMSVLHLRCDAGPMQRGLAERISGARYFGLDYFRTNIRWLREQGIPAAQLDSGGIDPPFGEAYDLILSNHILTHAMDPAGDLRRIRDLLKPGGHVLFYNELDHNLMFDRTKEHFRRSEPINYHQQLFVRESFECVLSLSGFDYEYAGHRKQTMTYLAKPSELNTPKREPVARDVVEKERAMALDWAGYVDHPRRRLHRTVRVTSRWLLRRHDGPRF